jgi:hypothetical protein
MATATVATNSAVTLDDPVASALPAAAALVPVEMVTTSVTSNASADWYIKLTWAEVDAEVDKTSEQCYKSGTKFAEDVNRLYLVLSEAKRRFAKKPGARNDLYDFPAMGWEAYLQSKGVKPGTFRQWENRTAVKLLLALVGAAPTTRSTSSPKGTTLALISGGADNTVANDVASALANLGYRRTDAKQAIVQALTSDSSLGNKFDGLLRRALASLKGITCNDGIDSDGNAVSDKNNVNTGVALTVLPSEELMCCGGCRDMHAGIAQLAWANPEWDDNKLVEASGCNLTTVRQARVRFLAWRKEVA